MQRNVKHYNTEKQIYVRSYTVIDKSQAREQFLWIFDETRRFSL